MHSLTLFTQLMMQVQQLGAPLDWSGAFARMVSDEARHTDLCLRMKEALGDGAALSFEERDLHLPVTGSLRAHVRQTVLSAFCIGETLSRRMFARCLQVATVPLAKEAVTAILVDETFHSELGWELGALLMRGLNEAELVEERRALVAALPSLYAHFAEQSGVTRDEAHTRAESEVDPEDEGVNFGTLSDAGYARAYFEGMREDVVPGLVAIGLPEAQPAWVEFVAHLE